MAKSAKEYWRHKVSKVEKNTGIIGYSAGAFTILGSKSAVKKAITGDRLLLNGKIAKFSDVVKNGDLIELHGTGLQKAKKYDVDLEIVYEDDFLLVVNKPGGIAVNGNRNKTVENAFADINRNNSQEDALPRPVAVHRIDVPTTGLVMLAKTKTALIKLSKAFQNNEVKKEYLAIVHGKTPAKGVIDEPIQEKTAVTKFETLQVVPSRIFKNLSLVRLQLLTGRTHQLRIHLKEKGHLIVGDKMYADRQKTIQGKGLLLCSCKIQFEHPQTGRMVNVEVDLPAKFERILQREGGRF
jgi:RluA family pseudouridine synthase